MNIVKFDNGKYGIVRGWLFKQFKDLHSRGYWWSMNSDHFPDCQGTLEDVNNAMGQKITYKIIK